MKRIKKFAPLTLVILVLLMPLVSFAAGLVPCNGPNCDFNSFLDLINKVINFLLKDLAIPIAAIMMVYAGFTMVIAGEESSSAKTKAKGILWNAVIGLIFAAAGWLIISTILGILGYDGSWIGLKVGL